MVKCSFSETNNTRMLAVVLLLLSIVFVVAGIIAITVAANSAPADLRDSGGGGYNKGGKGFGEGAGAGAKCSELIPVQDLKMTQLAGVWVLQEKLEFPDGMTYHTTVPNRDQTIICLRTEFAETTEREAVLNTGFFMRSKLTKNFTGYAKIKDNKHWDFRTINNDHDVVVVESEPTKFLVLVECVTSKTAGKTGDFNTPGSVFIYSRGKLAESELSNIRRRVENLLRYKDENLLDFGEYCV